MAGSEAVLAYKVSEPIESFLKKVPVRTMANKTEFAGSHRIALELKENPRMASFYIKKYEELVSGIAQVLKGLLEGKSGKNLEESFFREVWSIMKSNLRFSFRPEFYLYRPLQTNLIDCDTSAYLVYDIARSLNIHSNIVMTVHPPHAFIKTSNFFFETSSFDKLYLYGVGKIPVMYSDHYIIPQDKVDAESYRMTSVRYYKDYDYNLALDAINKAISIDPENFFLYKERESCLLSLAGSGDNPKKSQELIALAEQDHKKAENLIKKLFGNHMPYDIFNLSTFYEKRIEHLSHLIVKTQDDREFKILLEKKRKTQMKLIEEEIKVISGNLLIPDMPDSVISLYFKSRAERYDQLVSFLTDPRAIARFKKLAQEDLKKASIYRQ